MTRKLTFLILALFALIAGPGWGQTTFYHETFGTVSANTDYSPDASNLTDVNSATFITTFTSWKFSKSTTYPCDITGSSASSHIFCGTTGKDLILTFGNLTAYSSATLSFNYKNEAAKGKLRTLTVKVSSDGGTTWSDNILTNNTTQDWTAVNYELSATNKGNFAVMFSTTAANPSRIDDIILVVNSDTPSTDPVINVDDEVNLAYDETERIISCTVSNPTEEGALIFNLQEGIDWITNLFYITDGIYLNAEINDSYETRSAEITLSYEGAEDVVVTVNQAGRPAPSITCADITDVPYEGVTDAEATVTFNNAEGWNPSVTCDGDVVTAASLSENTITYSVSENTGSTDREGSFTITLSKEGENDITKVVSVTQKHFVVDYAELPFSYDDGKDNLPVGLTQSGLGSDYSSSPKMKFDGNGDYLILKINETPGILNYTIKGNGFSEGTFKLQTSVDGETYTDKKTYTALGNETTETITDLDASVRYIKWIYTNKSNGNVALGDIQLEKSASVATPTFTPAAGTYYEAQTVTIECETEDAIILYTLDGSTPTIESNIYLFPIEISETTTVKAIAYVGNEASNVATAVYTIISIPTYASLAELIDAGEPTTEGTQVNVTLTDETITGIFTTTQGYRNGIFLQVGEQEIEIYCHNVPDEWVIGGTVSGTLENCTWKKFNSTWELCPDSWDDLDYTAPQLYSITIYPSAFSEVTTSPADEAAAGTEVTITISNIEEHYHISEITVYDSYDNLVSVDDNGKFTMPESDVSISVTFLPDPQFFIHYYSNGSSDSFEIVYAGPIGELREPSELNFPEGFTFAGWSTSMASTTAITESYNVTANTDLFAIFARVEGGTTGSGNYEKVTSALTDWRGDYLIAYSDEVFMDGSLAGGKDGVGAAQSHVAPGDALSGNTITAEWGNEHYVTIEAIDDNVLSNGYVIKSHSTETPYFYHTANTNGMACTNNKNTAAAYPINIVFNNENDIDIALGGNAAGAILHYNKTNGTTGEMFRFYKDGGQENIYLYKKSAGTSGVTHYYTRVFQGHIVLDDITIEGPSIITAGSTLNMDTYTLTNTNPANLVIEDGAQLIHHNAGVTATVQKNITGYGEDNVQTRDGYYLIANPTARVASDEYDALEGASSGIDVYTFDPTEELEWRNQAGTSSRIPFTRTVGYLFASAEDRTMSFRGSLLPAGEATIDDLKYYDGNEAGHEFPGFNLIGNPFACNAYVQNYSFYTIEGDAVVAGTGAIAPCQGFMIETDEHKVAVELTTQAPEPAAAPSTMSIEVNQNRGNVIDRAIVRFDGANDMHKFMLNPDRTNIRLAKNGEEFAAISTEAEGELPVNFKAEKNGTYTITVNTENVEAEYLHLIDNMTGADTDLLSTPSYTFDAKTSDYASRFKLVFGVKNDNEEMSQASSFAYINNGEIVISNEGRATLQVIDVLGRIVSSEEINGECRISTNGLTAGLYILNLNGNVQKIVVR